MLEGIILIFTPIMYHSNTCTHSESQAFVEETCYRQTQFYSRISRHVALRLTYSTRIHHQRRRKTLVIS